MKDCLILDDSPVIRRVARVIIEDFDLEVREAENGRQGFEMCTLAMPDLILLDWQMPIMGALEFLRALRLYGPGRWPHIIYCTTELNFTEVQQVRSAGASDILLKPFDRRTLTQKLARFRDVLTMRRLAYQKVDEPWQPGALEQLLSA